MNKILLTLLCILTVSVFAGTTFASNDVTEILNNESIQISENTNMDISISEDSEISKKTKKDISYSQYNQTNQETTTFDDVNNSYAPNNNDLKPSESCLIDSQYGAVGINPENPGPICKLNNTDPNNPSDIVDWATELNNTNSNNSLDIKGPNSHSNLDIKGLKGPKLDSKQIELMKLGAILKKYKNENLTMVLKNTGDGRKVLAFYTTSSGLSGATSSCVGEVGSELVDILEKEGVFKKMAYGTVWGISKINVLFGGDELSDRDIMFLATGNLSPLMSMWWDEFTDDIGDWWDDLWD